MKSNSDGRHALEALDVLLKTVGYITLKLVSLFRDELGEERIDRSCKNLRINMICGSDDGPVSTTELCEMVLLIQFLGLLPTADFVAVKGRCSSAARSSPRDSL
jgi:hypothetical protein